VQRLGLGALRYAPHACDSSSKRLARSPADGTTAVVTLQLQQGEGWRDEKGDQRTFVRDAATDQLGVGRQLSGGTVNNSTASDECYAASEHIDYTPLCAIVAAFTTDSSWDGGRRALLR